MQSNVEKFGISDKRGRRRTHDDPYAPEAGLPGLNICRECHAVYHRKAWKQDQELYRESLQGSYSLTLCPACQRAEENVPQGFVTLAGAYLNEHRQEIMNGLQNVVDEAQQSNPLDRVIRERKEDDGRLEIETTTIKLAERLGRALKHSHHGEMAMTWTGDPPTCRVTWQRD